VRRGVDVGLHLGQQRIHHGLRHETLDDRHTRRGERRSNISRRRISSEARNVGRAETVFATPSVTPAWI